jgi:hypothetical protein
MTAIRTVLTRNGKDTRHYAATTKAHQGLFEGVIAATHAPTWPERWAGLRKAILTAKDLK